MKKNWFAILVILFFAKVSFGQTNYFTMDSVTRVGINLLDGGDVANSSVCRVKKGENIVKYSPDQVTEYGFKDGSIYFSREIHIYDSPRRVFLERLNSGDIILYYYRARGIKTFFIEKGNSFFIELPRRDQDGIMFREKLLNLTDSCTSVKDASKLVSYNKRSMSNFISRYNDCEFRPFPHFRYGIILGYEYTKLNQAIEFEDEFLKNFDFRYDGGNTIGLFIDYPLSVSDFSFHSELSYSRHGYSYTKLVENLDLDFVVNISSLKIPLLLRYVYPSNQIRPFIDAGGVLLHLSRSQVLFSKTMISGDIVEIDEPIDSGFIALNQIGFSAGAGSEYKLNYRNSLFIEFRFNRIYGILDRSTLNFTDFSINTGIIF